ncbi:L-threonylcarbamoyladenylate synthase [Brevirhabdus sp.]|uniref:L-threonylcarbamoyladenylate synthase n=1 Tax=Brevirhabdus sp. TaxID=2004514 RepID=UPI004057F1B1
MFSADSASETIRLSDDAIGLDAAAELLGAGGLVAFPTETVYGLGADARNDRAVARVFEAKGRPQFNPLIVHLPDLEAARAIAHLNPLAEDLAAAFWPGALTLVVPLRPDAGLSPLVTAGLPTVGIRVPDSPVAQSLLRRFPAPVAAPSANPSGRISPTSAAHVLEGLSGRIEAVLDGGSCAVGLESTIVLPDRDCPRLLRPGGIPHETIERAIGRPLAAGPVVEDHAPGSPGQMSSHYAPRAPLRLEARSARDPEVYLGFAAAPGCDLNLSPAGDLTEAAANLFGYLRRMDALAQGRRIAVSPIPDHGLGRAINDRLRRAAAPRPAG